LNPAFRKRKREFTLVGDIAKNNYTKQGFCTREARKIAIAENRVCDATRICALLAQLLPYWAGNVTRSSSSVSERSTGEHSRAR